MHFGCHKCETDCPMDIDIKQGVGQLSCIGCGECVDACNDVLGKRGIHGLIEFRYGTEPERATKLLTLPQKLGLWDGRRVGVALTLFVFLAITLWNVYGTRPLQATLGGKWSHHAHGGNRPEHVHADADGRRAAGENCRLLVDGLAGTSVTPSFVHLEARDTVNIPVTVNAPAARAGRQRITLHITDGNAATLAPVIFYTPDH